MGQKGDRGKEPNKTGTQPKSTNKTPERPKRQAGTGIEGQGSAETRAPSPKKVPARTTKKSRDK
jgi:hypothetical protein